MAESNETMNFGGLRIDRLNGDNYFAWKFRMTNYFRRSGSWGLVNGTTPRPVLSGTAVIDEESQKLVTKDDQALVDICLSVGDEQIIYVEGKNTANEAWKALATVYENAGVAHKMHLLDRLSNTRLRFSESAKAHIEEMRSIQTRLQSIGMALDKEFHVLYLLRSLPDEYSGLVVTLENASVELSLEDINARILREESRLKGADLNPGGSPAGQAYFGKGKKPFYCSYCHRKGHSINFCWKRRAEQGQKSNGGGGSSGGSNSGSSGGKSSSGKKSKGNKKGSGDVLVARHARDIPDAPSVSWYIDSGASFHMTGSESWFISGSRRPISRIEILLGDGTKLATSEIGDVEMYVKNGNSSKRIIVKDVLFLPGIKANLMSVAKIQERGHEVKFVDNRCEVVSGSHGGIILAANIDRGTFKVQATPRTGVAFIADHDDQTKLWHERLAHIGVSTLEKMVAKDIVRGLPDELKKSKLKQINCEGCCKGKMVTVPHPKRTVPRSSKILELIHSDVCGPMKANGIGGEKYFVTFVDDFSRKIYVDFMENKSEVEDKFRSFKKMVENETEENIKRLNSDNGGEYISTSLNEFLEECGIQHSYIAAYHPQQNGIAERVNRTIMEKARSMLHHMHVPLEFWPYAVSAAVYVQNRIYSSALDCTSHEIWCGRRPRLSHLRVFGCKAFVMIPHKKRRKLDPTSKECRFVGYCSGGNYRFYDHERGKFIVSPTANFFEGTRYGEKNAERSQAGGGVYRKQQELELQQATNIHLSGEHASADESQEESSSSSSSSSSESEGDNTESSNSSGHDSQGNQLIDENYYTDTILQVDSEDNSFHSSQAGTSMPYPESPAPSSSITMGSGPYHGGTQQHLGESSSGIGSGSGTAERQSDSDFNPPSSTQTMQQVGGSTGNQSSIPGPRRSGRSRAPPARLTYVNQSDTTEETGYSNSSQENQANFAVLLLASAEEPEHFTEAANSKDADLWEKAMDDEMKSHAENGTWILTERPKDRKPLSCKWVYKIKNLDGGGPRKYKARLVVKGFLQKYGIDYYETFAPVARMSSIRIILAISVQRKMFIHQMDVKTAFLNGDLQEEIYMEQPEGYVSLERPNAVCKLKKSLYGLKQAHRAWHDKIDQALTKLDFTSCSSDRAIYSRSNDNILTIICIYVDDLVISSDNLGVLNLVKKSLSSCFDMKDLGCIGKVLGIEVDYDRENGYMSLSQEVFTTSILKRFNMEKSKGFFTPMEERRETTRLNDLDSPPGGEENLYRSAVGCLMYLMLCTRPDICYTVGFLSKFSDKPELQSWKEVKRIFRYLSLTRSHKLIFNASQSGNVILGYSDASWGNNIDRKSVAGFCFYLGNSLVNWSSKKQSCVALSSTEAEIIAMSEAVREGIWITKFVSEIFLQDTKSFLLRVDNQSSMHIAKSEGSHGRSKHIAIKHLYVQEIIKQGQVILEYCPTDEMVADIFTKALQRQKFEFFKNYLLEGLEGTDHEKKILREQFKKKAVTFAPDC